MSYTLNAPRESLLIINGSNKFVLTFEALSPERTRTYASRVRTEFLQEESATSLVAPVEAIYDEGVELIKRYLVEVRQPDGTLYTDPLDSIKAQLLNPRAMRLVIGIAKQYFNVERVARDDAEAAALEAKYEQPQIASANPEDETAVPDVDEAVIPFDIFEMEDEGVALAVHRFDLETNEVVEYHLDFRLAEPTTGQALRYDNARQLVQRSATAGGTVFQRENADKVQRVFEERIRSIGGATFIPKMGEEPQPCEESNRGKWAPLVPYQLVSAAMLLDSRRGLSGNG